MSIKEGCKIPEGHSDSYIQNKLTTPMSKKEKGQTDK